VNINPEIAQEDNARPEPFATLHELVDEHGIEQVLQNLSDLQDFESQEENCCFDCRQKARVIHLKLELLLAELG
jgi:hypothetical protein